MKKPSNESVLTHETSRVSLICPNFPINQNLSLHQDGNDLTVSQCIFQPVPEDNNQWQTFP